MKVLLINNCHYRRGGADVVYLNTAHLLKQKGHEIVFLSFEDEKNIATDDHSYFIKWGSGLGRILSYFNNKDAARILDKILSHEKPDVAHAHLMWGGMTASIIPVLHKHGIPLVHTVHDYRMVCPAYTFRNGRGEVCEKCKGDKYYQCIINRCSKGRIFQSLLMAMEMRFRNKRWHPAEQIDGLIYVSYFAKQKHEEIDYRFKATFNTVLYNFTTIGDQYSPSEKDEGYYLYYGRLSYEKGIGTLVKAFVEHPELSLRVVGTGPKEEELKQMGNTNVSFLGYKTGSDLYELVRHARFVCVPSEWYENNPMTIVEAYSLGVPVIGANIGGIPEIIVDGETGFVFESSNNNSLALAIERSVQISESEYSAMKRNARLYADNHFSSEQYVKRLMSFYSEVIRRFNQQ